MDVSQALSDAENSLRDFISSKLTASIGDDWIEKCFDSEKVEKWNLRKTEEAKKQRSGSTEQRLIYYADFHELKFIINKRWDNDFKVVFDKKKELEVWLETLEGLRNADAHRRELMPHQKHLVVGISGEIRSRIVRYRSKMETGEDYFPRFESVRDSLGNIATAPVPRTIHTNATIRVGDQLDFIVTATDPQGGTVEYLLTNNNKGNERFKWQTNNSFSIKVTEAMISQFSQ